MSTLEEQNHERDEIRETFRINLKKAEENGKKTEYCKHLLDICKDKDFGFLPFSVKCTVALKRAGVLE